MLKHKLVLSGSIIAIVVMVLALLCTLPIDPQDPSNTKVSLVLRTTDKTDNNFIEDTAGNRIRIGAALNLPENVDSVDLKIVFDGTVVFDTMFKDFLPTSDTLWKDIIFYTEGVRTVTLTPYSSRKLSSPSATIKIIGKQFPENHAPTLNILGTRVIKPTETCTLTIQAFDVDSGQVPSVFMSGNPAGSQLLNNNTKFIWTAPAAFIGKDTVTFTVIDNGKPPLSTIEDVIITVTATPHPPEITVTGDLTLSPLETCTLVVSVSDEDAGQTLKISMSGQPDEAQLVSDSIFIWTVPADFIGENIVTFTVTDNGEPPLSSSIKTTITVSAASVNSAPKWDTETLPVPLKDTATYVKNLMDICHDADGDKITFTLVAGVPAGDNIIGTTYTFIAKPALVGEYQVMIIASDPSDAADTLTIDLSVTSSSTVDVTPPTITLVAPPEDSFKVTTPAYLIDVISSDVSGIASVTARLGGTTLDMQSAAGHYTVTMGGPKAGEYNKIDIVATDASEAGNKKTKTVYIKYTPGYAITYDGNGSTAGTVPVDAGSYAAGDTVTVKANTGSLVKTGSTFAGWNTAADGSGTTYAAGAAYIMGNTDDTLYARWTSSPTYTVIYDDNGSTGGTVPTDVNAYEAGDTVTVKANTGSLVKTGSTFAGWNTAADGSGTTYAAGATYIMGNTDDTLYARWTSSPTYAVIYDDNGSTGGTVPTDVNAYEAGDTVTVKANTGSLVKTGSTFKGWSTAADGSGTAYAAGATFIMGDKDDTLYARWTSSPTYAVVYDDNASTGGTVPTDVNAYEAGDTVTVKANTGSLVKTGSTFAGWNTAADGQGTTYAPGATFTMGSADDTLFAVWALKTTYVISISATNGSVTRTPDSSAYDSGTIVTLTPVPAANYHFTGWSGDLTGTANPATITMNSAKSVTAVFEVNAPNSFSLTVSAVNGSVTRSPNLLQYDSGTVVTLTPVAAPGYRFTGWSGDLTGTDNPASITMNSVKNVTATFAIVTYALDVTAANGSVTKTPNALQYDSGTVVTLTPVAATGYRFTGWSGDLTGTDNPASITMNSAKNVTATFTKVTYALDVTATNGSVTKTPNAAQYDSGTVVTLTPVAAPGYRFTGWSGALTGTANPGSITMNSAKNVTATFTIVTYALDVTATNGSVTKTPNASKYDSGTVVTLTPVAATGYRFTGWSGALTGTANPGSITMNSAKNVTATFTKVTYALDITATNGSVTKTPEAEKYDSGTVVTLTPAPATGYRFTGWSGDLTGTDNPASITMNSDKNVTANFTLKTYQLTLNAGSGGTIYSPASPATVTHGVAKAIVAAPGTGYEFANWTVTDGTANIANPTSASTTVTLTSGNATVTANFSAIPVTLTVTNDGYGTTIPSGSTSGTSGSPINISASPAAGYAFNSWTVTSGSATFGNPLNAATTVTITADATIRATFTQSTYRITYNNGGGSGTVPIDYTDYTYGSKATIKPNSGSLVNGTSSFVGWLATNGTTYACGQQQVTITGDLQLTARYSATDVMDNDGNVYTSKIIGNRRWLLQSLKTTKYRDATAIPFVTSGAAWRTNAIGGGGPVCAWADFNSSNSNLGILYNWVAVENRVIAPAGWRIATQTDWEDLYSAGNSNACQLINWTNTCSGSPGELNLTGFNLSESGYTYVYDTEPGYWSNSGAYVWASNPTRTYASFGRAPGGVGLWYYSIDEAQVLPLGYGCVIRCVKE